MVVASTKSPFCMSASCDYDTYLHALVFSGCRNSITSLTISAVAYTSYRHPLSSGTKRLSPVEDLGRRHRQSDVLQPSSELEEVRPCQHHRDQDCLRFLEAQMSYPQSH